LKKREFFPSFLLFIVKLKISRKFLLFDRRK